MRRLLAAILLFTLVAALPLAAQAPDANEQQLVALIKEVQAQQAQIAANQTKMESKLTEIGETIRVAHMFSGRIK